MITGHKCNADGWSPTDESAADWSSVSRNGTGFLFGSGDLLRSSDNRDIWNGRDFDSQNESRPDYCLPELA